MPLNKNDLTKKGDKVKVTVNVPMVEDPNRGYTHNVAYDGVVTEHYERTTYIQFTSDDGCKHDIDVCNYGMNSGYESYELLIDDTEFEKRKQEWIDKRIQEETEKFNLRIEELKNIKFR